jgi:hypothetical protein
MLMSCVILAELPQGPTQAPPLYLLSILAGYHLLPLLPTVKETREEWSPLPGGRKRPRLSAQGLSLEAAILGFCEQLGQVTVSGSTAGSMPNMGLACK